MLLEPLVIYHWFMCYLPEIKLSNPWSSCKYKYKYTNTIAISCF